MNRRRLKDGQRFGKLTIVGWEKTGGINICKCDCGKTVYAATSHLISGRHCQCRSCHGLSITKLMIGRKFGYLTVVSYDRETRSYICRCDCGSTTHAKSWQLKTGRHKRCGCGKTSDRLSTRLPNDLGTKRDWYRLYKNSAKNRGYSFSLSEKRFIELIQGNCHYCGVHPSERKDYHRKGRTVKANGVDRVDNTKGYTRDNCVSCCDQCNNSKASTTVEQWKEWINRVYKNYGRK